MTRSDCSRYKSHGITEFALARSQCDAGLVHLKGLANLKELNLSEAQVTDAGLVHLGGLAKLQTLGLGETRITDAGVAELQKALSNCKIFK